MTTDDGFNPARGIMLAMTVSLVLWGIIILAIWEIAR